MYPVFVDSNIKIKQQPNYIALFLPSTTKYYSFNKTGAEIIRLIDGQKSIDNINQHLVKKYNENIDVVNNYVKEFVSKLINLNILSLSTKMKKSGHKYASITGPCKKLCNECINILKCKSCVSNGFIHKSSVDDYKWYRTFFPEFAQKPFDSK